MSGSNWIVRVFDVSAVSVNDGTIVVTPAPLSSTDPQWFEVLRRWWFQLALVIWIAVLLRWFEVLCRWWFQLALVIWLAVLLRPSVVWGPSSLVVPAGSGHLACRPPQTLSGLRAFVAGGFSWQWSSGLPFSDPQWFEVLRHWWFQLALVIWLAVLRPSVVWGSSSLVVPAGSRHLACSSHSLVTGPCWLSVPRPSSSEIHRSSRWSAWTCHTIDYCVTQLRSTFNYSVSQKNPL